jgi:guanidinopropionase
MDEAKLRQLRARYSNGDLFDDVDPKLRAAARKMQSSDGKRPLPYSGISTFLDLPYATSTDDLDVALVGVPMDLGVSNRSGARYGPRAVRGIERIGPFHPTFQTIPRSLVRAADVGDVPFRSRYSLEQSIEDIEQYYSALNSKGIRPLSVGGDHSITYPILKALGKNAPLSLIHIDAHCDTMGAFDGSKFHHGGSFRLAVLDGVIDPEHTIQIGIRGSATMFSGFSHACGMTVISMDDFLRMGVTEVAERARAVVGGQPTYISIDIDVFDPAYAPGTGTPEAGGMQTREGMALLRALRGLNIVGGDIVEVAPEYDPTTNTILLAAQMLFEEFALMALT